MARKPSPDERRVWQLFAAAWKIRLSGETLLDAKRRMQGASFFYYPSELPPIEKLAALIGQIQVEKPIEKKGHIYEPQTN